MPETVPPEPGDEGAASLGGVARLAQTGAAALLASLVIVAMADGDTRWNLFAVISPVEIVGTVIAIGLVARRIRQSAIAQANAAGRLVAFGALTTAGAIGLVRFSHNWLPSITVALAIVVLLGALAILVAGIRCMRISPRDPIIRPPDPGILVLGLIGIALATGALFVHYDGYSSLWSEVPEGGSTEFFFEPAIAVAVMFGAVIGLGAWPRFASGLLLAAGLATSLHYVGVLIAAWRAIGEPGEVRSAGFIGVVGSLLVLAAGAYATRQSETQA
jgi:hypothetical protein